MTLIGPNGSGKSTILKSIIRQLGLVDGAVYLAGSPMCDMTEKEIATKMSVLMTERIRPELMTCEDVVATGRYPYTGRLGILSEKDRQKVREAIALVHAGILLSAISWRSATARGAHSPRQGSLPGAGGDRPGRTDIISGYQAQTGASDHSKGAGADKKVAVLMSLHELDLAQKLSDYIICIKGDRIERCGTPEEVLRNLISQSCMISRKAVTRQNSAVSKWSR